MTDVLSSRDRPLLVTGMARSGTSWVGDMLTASKCFRYIHEPFNLASPPGTVRVPVSHWYRYIDSSNEMSVIPALTDVLGRRYPLRREIARCRRPADLSHTARMWFRWLRARDCRPLLKAPHAVLSAGWFARRLGCQVLITVRHPAAVVSSWRRLGWDFDFSNLLEQRALMRDWLEPFRGEMTAAADGSHDVIDRVSLLWRIIHFMVAEHERRFPEFIVVYHERLSRSPVDSFASIYSRLGLNYSTDVAGFVARSSSSSNPRELPVADAYATAVDSGANLDAWKRRLTDEEFARIRATTAPVADRYYEEVDWAR